MEEDLLSDLQAFRHHADELLEPLLGPRDSSATGVVWRLIRVATIVVHELETEVHRPLGWSWTGFRIMYNTYVLGSVAPYQLARITGTSPPSISSALATLERDGFVMRRPSENSMKKVDVVLTKKGRKVVETVLPKHHDMEDSLFAVLTLEERLVLAGLLEKVLEKHWSL